MKSALPLLKLAGFRNLWIGQLISQFGDVLHRLVFLWMVLEITGSNTAVGTVGAFEALPFALLSVPAGVAADRYDRRRIMLLADIVCAILVFGFAGMLLSNPKPSLWVICLFAFLLGSAGVFAAPARNASIPRLVPPESLIDANTLNAATQNAMPLAGNALAAVVLKAIFSANKLLSYVLTFAFNGVTFLISAFFMWRLPEIKAEQDTAQKPSFWRETRESLHYIRHHPVLLPAMMAGFGINFFIAPFMPVYVIIAQKKFNGSPFLLALMETGFFLGMIAGSLLMFRFRVRRVGMAFSIYLALAAVTIVPMGYVESPGLFWLLNVICGVFIPPASVPLATLIQTQTPDNLRGRVNAVQAMISTLIMPLGVAMSGPLMEWLGIPGTFWFMGLGLGICPLLALLSRPFAQSILPDAATPEIPPEPAPHPAED
jgi:MFS transporter, DHA3 family, macrolide efflux protein